MLSLLFARDGSRIVAGYGGDDFAIRVWDVASEQVVQSFTGHTDGICSLALTRDERTLISGSLDKSIGAWNFESGLLVRGR